MSIVRDNEALRKRLTQTLRRLKESQSYPGLLEVADREITRWRQSSEQYAAENAALRAERGLAKTYLVEKVDEPPYCADCLRGGKGVGCVDEGRHDRN